MDGVLVDSEPLHIRVDRETLEHFGVRVSAEDLRGFTGMDNVFFYRRMAERYRIAEPLEELISHKQKRLLDALRTETVPVDGLWEMREAVTGLPLLRGLASSSFRMVVDRVLETLHLKEWFAATVAGNEVPVAKPDPAVYLKAAEMLGVSPGECMVVEDSRNGVQSARAAGMKVIGLRNPQSGNQDLSKAERIITSLRDLPAVLRSYLV